MQTELPTIYTVRMMNINVSRETIHYHVDPQL